MPEHNEIPAELEFISGEGTSIYDCWSITVQGMFCGYVYVAKSAHLIPTKLEFEPELVVETVY